MNTTFPILQKLFTNIESKELSGARFKGIEKAREAFKKNKIKLNALEGTAKVLGVEKAFYTSLKGYNLLLIINKEDASIEIIPESNDVMYVAYQMTSARKWEWWARGANLCIMLKCLQKLGAKDYIFDENAIVGVHNIETISCITAIEHGYHNLESKLPKIPPLKPKPKKSDEPEKETKRQSKTKATNKND